MPSARCSVTTLLLAPSSMLSSAGFFCFSNFRLGSPTRNFTSDATVAKVGDCTQLVCAVALHAVNNACRAVACGGKHVSRKCSATSRCVCVAAEGKTHRSPPGP